MGRFILMAGLCLAAAGALAEDGIPLGPEVFGALRARAIGPAVMSGPRSRRWTPWPPIRASSTSARPRAGSGSRRTAGSPSSRSSTTTASPSARLPSTRPTRTPSGWAPASRGCATASRWATASTGPSTAATRGPLMGLADTERIGKIVIDPLDPDTVYVAALGHLWDGERGARPLQDHRRRGDLGEDPLRRRRHRLRDVALVPGAPNVLFAAMWEFRRSARLLHARRAGQRALHAASTAARPGRSSRSGLPAGELGRIAAGGLAGATPDRIYAVGGVGGHRLLPLRRHGRHLGATSDAGPSRDGPSTSAWWSPIPRIPTASTSPTPSCW